MKTIQIDLEVSIHNYPADLWIDVEVPNDYERWDDEKQHDYLEKHREEIIKDAYQNIVITVMFNGKSL
ncbi:hypothetical protein [Anaerorhabdus sp.]|uniref:hypothetical protein n=1 Tax=Anaerorhabdus sp. TaxID=1872524 RepID=UPI002FCC7610